MSYLQGIHETPSLMTSYADPICRYTKTELAAVLIDERPAIGKHFNLEPALRRIGDRTDLKCGAVYLLSEASAYMTGGELLIDGGLRAGRKA